MKNYHFFSCISGKENSVTHFISYLFFKSNSLAFRNGLNEYDHINCFCSSILSIPFLKKDIHVFTHQEIKGMSGAASKTCDF